MKKVNLKLKENFAEIKNGTIYLYSNDKLRFCIHKDEFLALTKAYAIEELTKMSHSITNNEQETA